MTEIINKFQAVIAAANQKRIDTESDWWERFMAARRQGADLARVVKQELGMGGSHRSESRQALRAEWGVV